MPEARLPGRWPQQVPVLIAGGGPVGLTLAALLGHHGVRTLVVEADAGYCSGSRAICISRRSQEILAWVGADGDPRIIPTIHARIDDRLYVHGSAASSTLRAIKTGLPVAIAITLVWFWRVDRVAGWLFAPYLAWVSFASVLNFTLWRLNR